MSQDYFVFRESSTEAELMTLLKLRYRVYCATDLKAFIHENEQQLDVDAYDMQSRHFGLFKNDTIPVGCLRMVEDHVNSKSGNLQSCLHDLLRASQMVSQADLPPLPLLAYFPEAEALGQLYEHLTGQREKIVEVSRLCIDPAWRSPFLIKNFGLAILTAGYFSHHVDHVLITCSPLHKPFYQRLGITQLPGTSEHLIKGVRRCCLYGAKSTIPGKLFHCINTMKNEYLKTDAIHLVNQCAKTL